MSKYHKKISFNNSTLLLCFMLTTPLYAADVSSWEEIKTNKNDPLINMLADIVVEGSAMPISFNLAEPQTFDGNGHSITGASGYSLTLNNTADVTMQNLGSYSDGTAASNTFSFKNLDGDTIYKTIDKSVNSFPAYLLTRYKNDVGLSVDNSVFANNGGRIITAAAARLTINVTNSIFYNNISTVSVAPISGNGTSLVNIQNSIFYNNANTNNNGGVIDGFGTTSIKDSYFINNSARFGGVLNQISGIITIEGSKFEGNTSTKDGGAISLDGNINMLEYVKDSEFINNRNGGSYYDGGAISTAGGYIKTVENVIFDGNVSISGGGGIWGGMNNKHKAKDPVLFKNVTFKNNEAGQGGGYYSEGNKRANYTYITDSEFTENTVKKSGHYLSFGIPIGAGLINTGDVPMVINNTLFSGNVADSTGAGYSAGGGIYFVGDTADYPLKIVDSTFENNSALEGGALFVDNADAFLIANTKDMTFSGNTADANTDTYNGGDDIYFQANNYGTLSLNAAENKKIVFGGTIAAYTGNGSAATMEINKSGVTYNTYDGTTETPVTAGTTGEIQFNNKVGDEEGNFFTINLYGGTLSIGQNATVNATVTNPDGFINDNNFSVEGAGTLNTANGTIGEFAPKTFTINADLDWQFDVDLANATSDKLTGAVNNGSLNLSVLNVIDDTDQQNLKVTYSDTNINGILKDGYIITTSTATYDVTADNDDTGSYLLFSKSADVGGLPSAIKNGSASYSNTSGADEVITAWQGTNSLSADLVINGNNHAITTQNGLNGINVGASYTLTMNDVSDITGFNYAVNNAGTVELNNTTVHDDIINDGTLNVNSNVSLGAVSGTGTTNINADNALVAAFSGNTLNVTNATLTGTNNLAVDVDLNAAGSTIAVEGNAVTVNSATFDANSTLSLNINSLTDYGSLTAQNITVANGATLEATLSQGLVDKGDTASIQLITAGNAGFNNFSNTLDNNMYHFEKADNNGKYNVTLVNTAEDVVNNAGADHWVAEAAKAYVDGNSFQSNPVAAEIADKLAALAQNDSQALIDEIKTLAPTETAIVEEHTISEGTRLFKTVDAYLRGERDPFGLSSGDMFEDSAVWARPYFGKSKVHQSAKIIEQSSNSIGIITGLEKKVTPDLKIGVGLHYDKTDMDTIRRSIGITSFSGFLYTEFKPADWFINATGSVGQSHYNENKYALGTTYEAKYSVHTTSFATILGYQFKNITPEIGMHYYHIKREGYTDTAAQHIERSSTNYIRATGGVRFSKEYGIFRPDIYLGLAYDILVPDNNTSIRLANGSSYIVEGRNLSRMEYQVNIGLNAALTDNISLGAGYMGAFRENYREHTGIIRFKYDF
ncbi:MAG: autotransporter domain-containing protein [Alphaproteobacteria bacterium]|nr:autotransporter domain-containing protein [Alphaproteobacteria bacterium]